MENGPSQQAGSPPKRDLGIPIRGMKRRALSSLPSPYSSPLLPQSSSPSSPKVARALFPHTNSQSQDCKSTQFDIAEFSSDDSEPELGPWTAQTTPNSSPAQKTSHLASEKPCAIRPTFKPRTVSDPTPRAGGYNSGSRGAGVKSAQEIDGDIDKLLRETKGPSKDDKKLGYVYVVPFRHVPSGQNLIKIGFTAEASVDTRLAGVTKGKCRQTIERLPPSASSPEHRQVHLFYRQVEKLAHKELANFRCLIVCPCGSNHGEFFALDEEVGHMVVERWARFYARQQSAGDNGLRKREWGFHLDQFRMGNYGRLGEKQREKKDDHLSRHRRWESFLASKRLNWHVHMAGVLAEQAGAHCWQLATLAALTLLTVCTLSWWSFRLLVLAAGGVCAEKSSRDFLAELASLLLDMAVYYLRKGPPDSGMSNLITNESWVIEERNGQEGLDIWEHSEQEAETRNIQYYGGQEE